MPTRYWVGVVSRNHVQRGVTGGFAQVCHGKCAPLRRMSPGDVLIYYSPKTERDGGAPLKSFTAIGIVQADEPYRVEMTPAFHPFRINVAYDTQVEAAPIHPMLSKLSFTKHAKNWGMIFRRGLFEISRSDFDIISVAMNANVESVS